MLEPIVLPLPVSRQDKLSEGLVKTVNGSHERISYFGLYVGRHFLCFAPWNEQNRLSDGLLKVSGSHFVDPESAQQYGLQGEYIPVDKLRKIELASEC